MFPKILILAAAIGAASMLFNHFFNGADLDWDGLLLMGLVIVSNLRELQFDRIKEHYDSTFVTLMSFRDAAFKVCDDETIDRISLKAADIIVETAPEELQPELRKVNDLLKKMQNLKKGGNQNVEEG